MLNMQLFNMMITLLIMRLTVCIGGRQLSQITSKPGQDAVKMLRELTRRPSSALFTLLTTPQDRRIPSHQNAEQIDNIRLTESAA